VPSALLVPEEPRLACPPSEAREDVLDEFPEASDVLLVLAEESEELRLTVFLASPSL